MNTTLFNTTIHCIAGYNSGFINFHLLLINIYLSKLFCPPHYILVLSYTDYTVISYRNHIQNNVSFLWKADSEKYIRGYLRQPSSVFLADCLQQAKGKKQEPKTTTERYATN